MNILLDLTLRGELNFALSCKCNDRRLCYHFYQEGTREQMFSLATIYQIFGNNTLADRVEKLGNVSFRT